MYSLVVGLDSLKLNVGTLVYRASLVIVSTSNFEFVWGFFLISFLHVLGYENCLLWNISFTQVFVMTVHIQLFFQSFFSRRAGFMFQKRNFYRFCIRKQPKTRQMISKLLIASSKYYLTDDDLCYTEIIGDSIQNVVLLFITWSSYL